jgi:hypothetical protein
MSKNTSVVSHPWNFAELIKRGQDKTTEISFSYQDFPELFLPGEAYRVVVIFTRQLSSNYCWQIL